jgi:hypothetical protein
LRKEGLMEKYLEEWKKAEPTRSGKGVSSVIPMLLIENYLAARGKRIAVIDTDNRCILSYFQPGKDKTTKPY